VYVCIIAPKSIEVNHPLQFAVEIVALCSTASVGLERVAYDGIGCIIMVQLEALAFYFFNAHVQTVSGVDKVY
jgi:hypothetical protein